jgi:hypothetical protein
VTVRFSGRLRVFGRRGGFGNHGHTRSSPRVIAAIALSFLVAGVISVSPAGGHAFAVRRLVSKWTSHSVPKSASPKNVSLGIFPHQPVKTKQFDVSLNLRHMVTAKETKRAPKSGEVSVSPIRDLQRPLRASIATPPVNMDIKLRDRHVGYLSGEMAEGVLVPRLGSENSSVREVQAKASAFDDRLRLTVVESRSLYSASLPFLLQAVNLNSTGKFLGKERFLFLQNNEGFAGRERVDVTLFREGQLSASVIATNTHVDSAYYVTPVAGREGFSTPLQMGSSSFGPRERSGSAAGVQVSYGSISLHSSFGRGTVADRLGEHVEGRVSHNLSWDLRSDPLVLAVLPSALVGLVPNQIYAGVYQNNAAAAVINPGIQSQLTGALLRPDGQSPAGSQIKGMSGGANWRWDGGFFNVSYFSYKTDASPVDSNRSANNGGGLSSSGQFDVGPFGFKAGLYYGVGRDWAQEWRGKTLNYSGNASLTYRAQHFPDLFVDGNFGQYAYGGGGYGSISDIHSKYWSITSGFDFVKYLQSMAHDEIPSSHPPAIPDRFDVSSLKLFYRRDYFSDAMTFGARAPNGDFVGVSLIATLR